MPDPTAPIPRQRRPESRRTEVPGERIHVTLDIAKDSLPVLLEGQRAAEIKLIDNGDGTYSLTGMVTIGDQRAEGIVPYADKLKTEMDRFALALYEHAPTEVVAAWEEAVDRLDSWKGERR